MKNLFCAFFVGIITIVLSCNDAVDKQSEQGKDKSKSQVDSLLNDVMEGHNIGMAKMGRLTKAEQTTQRLLDSIAKLPLKARQAAAPVKAKLDSLQKDLSYADFAMNKWMREFKMDSAINNIQERIDYLAEEKLKVTKVKEAILGSLSKADSLLKEKF